MRHIWTVVCNHAVIDKDTNNVSLLDVLEEITILDKPVSGGLLPIPMEFMTFWIRDNLSEPCKGTYRMLYTKPSGEQFGMSPEIEVDLSNHERSRNKLIFRGMNVDQGGEYTFVIEVREDQNWREVTRVPLKINFIVREEQQSSNPAQ